MRDGTWESDESEDEFRERTIGSIESIIDRHPGGQRVVAVVSWRRDQPLPRLTCSGSSERPRGFFYPNYTSIHRVAAASSGERSVVTVNETSHLRGTGLPMGLFQNS